MYISVTLSHCPSLACTCTPPPTHTRLSRPHTRHAIRVRAPPPPPPGPSCLLGALAPGRVGLEGPTPARRASLAERPRAAAPHCSPADA